MRDDLIGTVWSYTDCGGKNRFVATVVAQYPPNRFSNPVADHDFVDLLILDSNFTHAFEISTIIRWMAASLKGRVERIV